MTNPADTLLDIMGPEGILAGALPGFRFRPSQLQMARRIQEAIRQNVPALIEAGTGTGKTLGYLAPVLQSGKKTVISTGTKNLQEQIFFKDIPLLQDAAGLDIDAVMMKGRENYLCLYRYHQYTAQGSLLRTGQTDKMRKIEEWLRRTRYADRAEIPWLTDDDPIWGSLSASSEQCLGSDCPHLEECFLMRLRSRAAKARIIVVNHHLFFADLRVRMAGFGEIIPRFQVAVFDEAHTIEEIATAYFGESLSTRQVAEWVGDLRKGTGGKKGEGRGGLQKDLDAIEAASQRLRDAFEGYGEKGRVDAELLQKLNEGPGYDLKRGLREACAKPGLKDDPHLRPFLDRAGELERLLEETLRPRGGNWLNWYEKRKRSLVLHVSPLDISRSLNELLYETVQTTLFTSATLTANGKFDYIRTRLGLPETTLEEVCPSPFDFRNQALLYIPRHLPVPSSSDFGREAGNEMLKILIRTQGRALVLFTSYHNLEIAHEIIRGQLPFQVYRQGDAPRSILLDAFRRDVHSVLLATGAFWQGVDVPGESLSCLIIDKLPFDSPGDPVVAARIEAIRARGGNPFMEYQVPTAIIMLKQGLGRLIRKESDRGILAILDIRIHTSRYGRFFLESLPPVRITHDLEDIERFFGGVKAESSKGNDPERQSAQER